ncbi:hatching enzyme 1.2 [Hetaerina americana]|uniref:hatching enzyme 1.2 n=1 Tax=Hetaerina americana TaxID=62018 RepID=UPI003A7F10E8
MDLADMVSSGKASGNLSRLWWFPSRSELFMDHPEIFLLLLATASGLPFGPTFVGYFREGFPFQEVATKIAAWSPDKPENVWELSGQFEGDIMLLPDQAGSSRNIIINEDTRWPNATLPYYIDPVFSEGEREIIMGALAEFNQTSCMRLVPYTANDEKKDKSLIDSLSITRSLPASGDEDESRLFASKKEPASYIWIQGEPTGCWSMVGRQKGPGGQVVNLQRPGCVHHGVIVHEVLHALGFFHQQSAYNRDDYVDIIWDKIEKGKESNFHKYNSSLVTDFGVEYDYSSVMHYGRTAFSNDGSDTIVPKDKDAKIGQRKKMSEKDLAKLMRSYCEQK